MRPNYAEAYWSTDFVSTEGFDIFCKRNQEGKRFCKDVEEFLKQRAKMESDYAKALQNLAKGMKPREEYGADLEVAWNVLREQVETMATIHSDASSFLSQQMEDLHRFRDDQTKERTEYENRMKKSQNYKISQYQRTMNAQKEYQKKCRDKDSARESYEGLKSSITTKTKDLERAQTKLEKSTEDMKKADEAYKSSVEILDEARVAWERDWRETCQTLQARDEERVEYLREAMWRAANVDSKVALDVDEAAENIRASLEKVDVAADLEAFQEKSQIGSRLPDPIPYVNYYTGEKAPKQRTPPEIGRSLPLPSLPTTPSPSNNNYNFFDDDGGLYSTVKD